MGAFGDFFLGTEGTPGEHGIDVQYIDEYDDYAAYRKQLIDYFTGIMAGEEPDILTRYNKDIEAEELSNVERMYRGTPGARDDSAYGRTMQGVSQLGGNKKAEFNQLGRVVDQEALAKIAALARSAKFRRDFMAGAQFQATGGLQALDRNPEYYASAYNIQPTEGTQGFLSKAADKALDYGMAYATGGLSEMAKAGASMKNFTTGGSNALNTYMG